MERDQASKFVNDLLRLMVSRNGSDLFLTADFPPAIKVDGRVTKVSPQPLTGQHTLALTRAVMNDKQAAEFERTKECNFAISPQGIGRFRVNAFVQQGNVGLVMRTIPQTLPTIDSLGLPVILKDIAMTKRGLVIFVGATGSGKSTSLAAMVDYRNENSYGHIITVEDPVEFVHPHKNCIVTQREVGIDTDGWEQALKNTLRQASSQQGIGNFNLLPGSHLDHAGLAPAFGRQRIGRVGRNGFPPDEKDAPRAAVRPAHLDGARAVDAAADHERLALSGFLVGELPACDRRRRVERRATNERILGGRQRRQGLTRYAHAERISADLVATGGGAHQVDADRVVAIRWQHGLELASRRAADEHGRVRPRRVDVEIVLWIGWLEHYLHHLTGTGVDPIVHIVVALDLA